ncbi:hypothetical protein GCM10007108_07870 [Thermogymnomonas acidicola]|uniref:Nop domain-containing protein n=1 Tax=Thermogymnomonas acidicola TaxID=399579 RepID=A0AA37BRJ8_9ARCH|nr:hypothetical protein [Thermogymnomonas acidicola]GGM72118.1 hypothetical protein GCM10007108_07870 [Thermogymnomonas acidicola]
MSGRSVRWYGVRRGEATEFFRDLDRDFIGVFDSLRSGSVPETGGTRPGIDLRQAMIEYAKKRLREEFTEDQVLIRGYLLKKELDTALNSLVSRVSYIEEAEGKEYSSGDICSYLRALRPGSIDESVISGIRSLCDARETLLSDLEGKALKVAPNTLRLVGLEATLELLYRTGGLRRLASLPASRIQLVGAERALFRHLTSGSPPPKHGCIFKAPLISSLRAEDRGRAARVLACKIAIASRADLLGRDLGEEAIARFVADVKRAGFKSSRVRSGRHASRRVS